MNNTETSSALEITVTAKRRIWCDVIVHHNERDDDGYHAKVKRASVERCNIPMNERTQTQGYLVKEYSKYGTKFELVLFGDEERYNEVVEQYIKYFRNAVAEGWWSRKAETRLHGLKCHKYDEEIEKAKSTLPCVPVRRKKD